MKLKAKIYQLTAGIITAAAASATLTGCDSVIYDESDCVDSFNTVRFEYTRNMKSADAFAAEVSRVTMLVFSSDNGKLVKRFDIPKSELRNGNTTDLRLDPGDYDILVWAGEHQTHYDIAAGEIGTSTLSDFHCRIKTESIDGTEHSSADIAALYHGLVHLSLPYSSPSAPNEIVIPLTKDTNVIRVVLQHISGEAVDHDKFDFVITDSNSWLNHDNSLRDPQLAITYHPWHTVTGSVDVNTNPTPATGGKSIAPAPSRAVLGASLAEFTVNRLFMSNDPILTVTDKSNGKTVFSIPVRDYALLVKGFHHEKMDDQEYLDRQDEYNMTFFLDEDEQWISTVIIINDWRIVRHNVDAE